MSNLTLPTPAPPTDLDNDKQYLSFSFTFFGPVAMGFSKSAAIFDEPEPVKVTMSVLLTLIMLLSIVGNVSTCVVIARFRSMRTATNVYLFCLAVSDLLLALWIPVDLYVVWFPEMYPLGEFGCVLHVILLGGLTNFSMLTIAAFTVERYVAVVKPFLLQTRSKLSRVVKLVVLIGVTSILLSCPEGFSTYFYVSKDYIFCYTYLSLTLRWTMGLSDVLVIFAPMFTTSVLYVLIAMKLRAKNKLNDKPTFRPDREKAVKMLAAVAVTFIVSWFPYFILRLMMLFPTHLNREQYYPVWRVLYYMCTISGYLSTAINPILYSVLSRSINNSVCLKVWRVLYYMCTISGYLSTAINPILYSVMSRKFRMAFVLLLKRRRPEECGRNCNSIQSAAVIQLTPSRGARPQSHQHQNHQS